MSWNTKKKNYVISLTTLFRLALIRGFFHPFIWRSGRLGSTRGRWGQRRGYWRGHWRMDMFKLVLNMFKFVQNGTWARMFKNWTSTLSVVNVYGIGWKLTPGVTPGSGLAPEGWCIEFVGKLHILLVKWRLGWLSSWGGGTTWGPWTMTLGCAIVT